MKLIIGITAYLMVVVTAWFIVRGGTRPKMFIKDRRKTKRG